MVFEDGVLIRIFEHTRVAVTGGWSCTVKSFIAFGVH
jgi:hypothetical protein